MSPSEETQTEASDETRTAGNGSEATETDAQSSQEGEAREGEGEGQGEDTRADGTQADGGDGREDGDGEADDAEGDDDADEGETPSVGTIADLVLEAAQNQGTALRFKAGDEWVEISYSDLDRNIRDVAKGLMAIGLDKGDRVAIFSDTRPEWVLADLATALAGGVVATVYQTASAEEVRHVLENSGARLVFCENPELVERVEEARDGLEHLERVVMFQGETPEGVLSMDDLRRHGAKLSDETVTERAEQVSEDDLFTLVYTSGTTGPAKGCMLTHGNLRWALAMLEDAAEADDESVFYAFLPLAHVLTRMTELLAVDLGAEIAFWQRDKDKLLEDLRELQPTHFAAVPRVFEKIYNEATGKASGVKGKALDKAVALGLEARQKEAEGREFSFGFETKYDLADDRILSKVRDIFGGNLKFALTGAAPVSKEMLEFFYAADVLVLEGYGLTETSGVATVNTPEAFRFGTQGKPVTHCEVRIGDRAEDSGDGEADEGATDPGGEVLVRGPNVFRGYYKMEEETAEELDEDGWFHTGDVGSIDEDGFLSITGRTKDIIVTSSGKNVAAAHIENTISQQRYISHAVLFGDERNYLVALVTIDEDERSALAKEAGVDDDPETMAESPEVREKIWAAIEEANQSFAQIEQVKRFAILPRDLSQEQGELTPTLKVKRNAVYENERERFEALYEEDSG